MLRRLTEEDWAQWRELRLAALAEAPYAFSSTLADWTELGDREERWRRRLVEVPYNVVAEWEGRPAGMVSCTAPMDGQVELVSMWVAPGARGNGLGEELIASTVAWARSEGAERLVLSVRTDNAAAIGLYARCGFSDTGPADESRGVPPEQKMVRSLAS